MNMAEVKVVREYEVLPFKTESNSATINKDNKSRTWKNLERKKCKCQS